MDQKAVAKRQANLLSKSQNVIENRRARLRSKNDGLPSRVSLRKKRIRIYLIEKIEPGTTSGYATNDPFTQYYEESLERICQLERHGRDNDMRRNDENNLLKRKFDLAKALW